MGQGDQMHFLLLLHSRGRNFNSERPKTFNSVKLVVLEHGLDNKRIIKSCRAQLSNPCCSERVPTLHLAGLSFYLKCIKRVENVVSIETDVRLTWAANFHTRGLSGATPLLIKLCVPQTEASQSVHPSEAEWDGCNRQFISVSRDERQKLTFRSLQQILWFAELHAFCQRGTKLTVTFKLFTLNKLWFTAVCLSFPLMALAIRVADVSHSLQAFVLHVYCCLIIKSST